MDDTDLERIERSPWDRLRFAIGVGDTNEALLALDALEGRWRSLQDYSVNWVAALLSFIGRELGEEAVERALREFGDGFVAERRGGVSKWWALPAEARARAIAEPMLANGATVQVTESDSEITLTFRCGTGGRLIDDCRYDGPDGYLTLRDRGPMTFGRDELPVYCAHCSINNELQPIEVSGLPTTVEDPPRHPGEACVHHVHRRPADVPDEVWTRVGRTRPSSS